MISSYDGGKGNIYQHLINLIPPHSVFASLFLGHCAIMRNKRPASVNIGLDLDTSVIIDWMAGYDSYSSYFFSVRCATSWLKDRSLKVSSDWFLYLDPPYLFDVRSSKRPMYKHEFGRRDQHMELLGLLIELRCMVMISGYDSQLYDEVLTNWRKVEIPTYNRANKPVIECVWMNYGGPCELHDYTHLGDDYRERERIKKKRKRWLNNYQSMSQLERRAILNDLILFENGGTYGD